MTPLEVVSLGPVIPVVTLHRAADAVPLTEALLAGGVRAIEVTLRTRDALEGIALAVRECPDAAVGAGTVTDLRSLDAALEAGSRFVVTPGLTPTLAVRLAASGVAALPGAVTASEVMAALDAGFDVLKFFPAVPAGGIPALKALHGPFGDVRFCPTGGIGAQTAPEFLALANVACVGGSWLVPEDAIAAGDWGRITALAAAAAALTA